MAVIIDANDYGDDGWKQRIIENVKHGENVILENFDPEMHLEPCKQLAVQFGFKLRVAPTKAYFCA